MARFDKDFAGAERTETDMPWLFRGLGSAEDRRQAIIALLTATEGWREAAQRLGGAFAEHGATRLRSVKEE